MEKTLVGCMLSYFGKKGGQTMADFAAEIKVATATQADRDFFVSEFTRIGFKVLDA